jgi:serine/threonine protein kinase/tetratricopeptide (TPR) repeat protein
MIGTTLGHYRIVEKIGEGGMGVVYRAHDKRLDRDVAVKVLPEKVASDQNRVRRFKREAKAVAALSHPNILEIFDFDTESDVTFAVTEFLDGETLHEHLHKERGPLPLQRVLEIGEAVADGLGAAHGKGVVHRDVKPSNIFLCTDGRVKILDFGLAATHEVADTDAETGTIEEPLTREGVALGTVGYMSPEQVRGEPADFRTDVFALGCVLYEMLVGKRAFSGDSDVEAMAATLSDEPLPLSKDGISVPAEFERVLSKALAKDSEDRYSDASELLTDLRLAQMDTDERIVRPPLTSYFRTKRRRWFAVSTALLVAAAATILYVMRTETALAFASRDWILVCDFDNQTDEPLFDKALVTAFTVSLEQSQHANVFPRSRLPDVFEWMGMAAPEHLNPEIGREVCQRANIRGLVTCAIGRIGDQYFLTARLVDPTNGVAVRSYTESASDQGSILDALGMIARDLRRDLGESLLRIQQSDQPLAHVTTSSLDALRLYTEASLLWAKSKYDDAVALFHEALEYDPEFAMAHAALGNSYSSFIFNARPRGLEHFEKALTLTDRMTDRERLSIEASYRSSMGHWDEAIRLYKLYLALYPDDIRARYSLGKIYMNGGRTEEAIGEFQQVLRVDPRQAPSFVNIAASYALMGSPCEALPYFEKAFEMEPDWITGHLNHEYGFSLVNCDNIDRARDVFSLAMRETDSRARALRSMALLDSFQGQYSSAEERFEEAISLHQAQDQWLSEARVVLLLSALKSGLDDRAGQLDDLERAAAILNEHEPQTWLLARVSVDLARAGAVQRASQLFDLIQANTDNENPQQRADLNRLEGEIELALDHSERALELLELAVRDHHAPLFLESLARAYRLSGQSKKAVSAYEKLVMEKRSACTGWEMQQPWIAAHLDLARLYREGGDPDRALEVIGTMLDLWRDADPDLPLLQAARQLQRELAALN